MKKWEMLKCESEIEMERIRHTNQKNESRREGLWRRTRRRSRAGTRRCVDVLEGELEQRERVQVDKMEVEVVERVDELEGDLEQEERVQVDVKMRICALEDAVSETNSPSANVERVKVGRQLGESSCVSPSANTRSVAVNELAVSEC